MGKKTVKMIIFKNKLNIFLIALALLVSSCQSFQRSQTVKPVPPVKVIEPEKTNPLDVITNPVGEAKVNSELTEPMVKPETIRPMHIQIPKFGIILSGGGARAWGHVAILKEMQKYKFPILSVAGIEWGAFVAASYAQSASANEVEWEFSKVGDLDDWEKSLNTIFEKKNTTGLKIPFVCPSYNLKTKMSYLLNRGPIAQLLSFCLPSAGVIEPYKSNLAYMNDVAMLVNHLKATGINKVILVNVLKQKNDRSFIKGINSLENQIWTEASIALNKKAMGLDEVIEIDLSDYDIDAFNKKSDIMAKSAELSYNVIKRLADKYKL